MLKDFYASKRLELGTMIEHVGKRSNLGGYTTSNLPFYPRQNPSVRHRTVKRFEGRRFDALAKVTNQRFIRMAILGLFVIDAGEIGALAKVEGLDVAIAHLTVEGVTRHGG